MTPIKVQRSEGSQTVPMTAPVAIAAASILMIHGTVCIAVQSVREGDVASFFKRCTVSVLQEAMGDDDLQLGAISGAFVDLDAISAPGWKIATRVSSDPMVASAGETIARIGTIEAIDDGFDIYATRVSLALGDGAGGGGADLGPVNLRLNNHEGRLANLENSAPIESVVNASILEQIGRPVIAPGQTVRLRFDKTNDSPDDMVSTNANGDIVMIGASGFYSSNIYLVALNIRTYSADLDDGAIRLTVHLAVNGDDTTFFGRTDQARMGRGGFHILTFATAAAGGITFDLTNTSNAPIELDDGGVGLVITMMGRRS